MSMKNITLSVNEDDLAAARRYASEQNATVNSLVRTYLSGIARRHGLARQARARLRELSEGSEARRGATTWTRDDLHEG